MTETVRDLLLDSRIWVFRSIEQAQADIEGISKHLARAKSELASHKSKLADIEADLRGSGFDLETYDGTVKAPNRQVAA